MAGARAENHRSTEQAWDDATKPRRSHRKRTTRKQEQAAVDGAKDDIENWLASTLLDPSAAVPLLLSTLGDAIATDSFGALCEALGRQNTNKLRAEFAEKHFFCQLLAEVACAMRDAQAKIDDVIKGVTGRLVIYCIGRRDVKIPPLVAHIVTDATAKSVSNALGQLPVARTFQDLLLAARILAFTMCPAPENHETVVRCALRPLGEPIVSGLVQERLKAAMPGWLT